MIPKASARNLMAASSCCSSRSCRRFTSACKAAASPPLACTTPSDGALGGNLSQRDGRSQQYSIRTRLPGTNQSADEGRQHAAIDQRCAPSHWQRSFCYCQPLLQRPHIALRQLRAGRRQPHAQQLRREVARWLALLHDCCPLQLCRWYHEQQRLQCASGPLTLAG